jgi:parvulin-like peptidyl-prolyl isomerase
MTEADVRALFEYVALFNKLIEDFAQDVPDTVEQVLLAQILVETQAEAEELLARLEAGESFAELAAEASLDAPTAYRGGEVGWVSEDVLAALLPGVDQSAVFNLPVGEPGGPFETEEGYYLLMVYDRQADVPLAPAEYLQKQQQEFQAFLNGLRAEAENDIEIDDNWQRFLTVIG